MGLREEHKKSGNVSTPLKSGNAGVPLLGLALFLLIAHAFLVSVLHSHPSPRLAVNAPRHGPAASGRSSSEDAPSASRHAQCSLCSLQRNFVAELDQNLPVLPSPARRPAPRAAAESQTHADISYLAPAGRAPPAA